ncbi:MAG: site-specific integrase, partial [Coriobacteriales bacterium]|nr:site-specific integrase [Coriobacteriales bacterium]
MAERSEPAPGGSARSGFASGGFAANSNPAPVSELTNVLDGYLAYMAVERGASPLTVEAYGRDVNRYILALNDASITTFSAVTRDAIVSHIDALRDVGYAPASIERAVAAIKGFHKFAVREGYAQKDPSSTVRLPKVPKKLPNTLSLEQVNMLLDQDFPDTPAGARDHALLEVLYGCGLRVSEICGLDLSYVLFSEGVLRVRGKGNK